MFTLPGFRRRRTSHNSVQDTRAAAPAGSVATVVHLQDRYCVAQLRDRDLVGLTDPIADLATAVALRDLCQAAATAGDVYRVVAA